MQVSHNHNCGEGYEREAPGVRERSLGVGSRPSHGEHSRHNSHRVCVCERDTPQHTGQLPEGSHYFPSTDRNLKPRDVKTTEDGTQLRKGKARPHDSLKASPNQS